MANDVQTDKDTAALCRRLETLPVSVVSDVLNAMGFTDQVLSSSIRFTCGSGRVAGPAYCVRGRSGPEPKRAAGEPSITYELDRRVRPGVIAVIETGGNRTTAVMGGNVALSLKLRGCRGVLTDGGVRDLDEYEEIGMPVFCSFLTTLAPKGRWHYAELDVPIALPGQTTASVPVRPGDLIHGDRDGVLVIAREHAASVTADAEEMEHLEGKIKLDLEAGADREEVYRRNDRFAHMKKVR